MKIHMKRRFDERELLDMKSIQSEVDAIAAHMEIGETLFFKEKGVKSEGEYKKRMAAQGKVMKHSHIGWNSWQATEEGFILSKYMMPCGKREAALIDLAFVWTGLWEFQKNTEISFKLALV